MEDLIFSVEAHSGKELRHFKFISVSFMAQLLGSASFIGKVNHALANAHYPVFTSVHVSVILMAIANGFSCVDIQNNPESFYASILTYISWLIYGCFFLTSFSAKVRNKTKTIATTIKHIFNSLLLSLICDFDSHDKQSHNMAQMVTTDNLRGVF